MAILYNAVSIGNILWLGTSNDAKKSSNIFYYINKYEMYEFILIEILFSKQYKHYTSVHIPLRLLSMHLGAHFDKMAIDDLQPDN